MRPWTNTCISLCVATHLRPLTTKLTSFSKDKNYTQNRLDESPLALSISSRRGRSHFSAFPSRPRLVVEGKGEPHKGLVFDKIRAVLGHRPLNWTKAGGGAPLEHRSVAIDEDWWLFGVWPVDLGNFATTL